MSVAVAGVMLLSEPLEPAPEEEVLPSIVSEEPDLYIEDAVITQYLPSGTVHYRLMSKLLRQFEADELVRLTEPRLVVNSETRAPWRVQSEHGYVRRLRAAERSGDGEEVVFLREDVQLEQREPDGRHMRLTTSTLYVFPEREYAETDRDVMIDTHAGRTTATGLKGDLQRGLLQLSSSDRRRVHTILLPDQFK
ncbi:MAG: LPS export ABC transporter periplasmic protein LptC [Pseudomonadales bacterium]|nr:LPS export ABC transporter periplasmic protein LptC [Pseudomonadales bacterium]NIX06894.1 LPS export ABC transporter periplasmic protein LptC [Pseudomonadales bacterium]